MMMVIVGVIIGLVLGLTGAGGSVFAVPVLVNVLGLPMHQAAGLSLGAVGMSALYGVVLRAKGGHIEWLPAIVFSVLGGLGAPLGALLNRQIEEQYLLIGFSILVLVIAIRMWRQASLRPQDTKIVRAQTRADTEGQGPLCRANAGKPFKIGVPCVLGMATGALSTGVLSGLFGVGGGFLIVPILLALTGITMQQAVATSLAIISVVSLVGFSSFFLTGSELPLMSVLLLSAGGIAGMSAGIVLSHRIAGPVLQRLFAVLMLLTVVVTLFNKL